VRYVETIIKPKASAKIISSANPADEDASNSDNGIGAAHQGRDGD
jgi:hypothetical protein